MMPSATGTNKVGCTIVPSVVDKSEAISRIVPSVMGKSEVSVGDGFTNEVGSTMMDNSEID